MQEGKFLSHRSGVKKSGCRHLVLVVLAYFVVIVRLHRLVIHSHRLSLFYSVVSVSQLSVFLQMLASDSGDLAACFCLSSSPWTSFLSHLPPMEDIWVPSCSALKHFVVILISDYLHICKRARCSLIYCLPTRCLGIGPSLYYIGNLVIGVQNFGVRKNY